MKTTFSRQFALIAALLLVCMLFTGVSFRFLMLRYLKNDKKETLSADAAAVASLAEAYDSTGELEENWDFRLSLSLFSDVGEAEAQVCDENGFVVLCSCDEFNCEHLGRQIDADLITEIDMNGETFRVGTLTGIHDGRRYIAGRPIVSDDTEQTIGYVIISSDMSQITDFMQRSSSLFFYSAIIVLVLSMAAARPPAASAAASSIPASRCRRAAARRSSIWPTLSTPWPTRSKNPSSGGRSSWRTSRMSSKRR